MSLRQLLVQVPARSGSDALNIAKCGSASVLPCVAVLALMEREVEGRCGSGAGLTDLRPETEAFSAENARKEFSSFIAQADYPCLGAKAALNAASIKLKAYDKLGSGESSLKLALDLGRFLRSDLFRQHHYASFIATFAGPLELDEIHFEQLLWQQLAALNRIDAGKSAWDPEVSSDPADPHFSFSFAGQALYVIGLHRQSSRMARRFRWPTLIFNAHEQFEKLRTEGKWKRMQQAIRQRDLELQGNINPMLSDFGERSEARQYSGRQVETNWQPDFRPAQQTRPDLGGTGGCPFHH